MLATLVSGIINGGSYALLAVGISLIFGVSNIINFAQGSVYAVGALTGWWLITAAHWPLWAAVLGVVVFTGLLGLAVNVLTVAPLSKSPPIATLLATFAVSIIIENTAQLVFSPDTRRFPQLLDPDNLSVAGVRFGTLHVVILVVTVLAIVGLQLFLRHSRWGRAVRATAQDREAAAQSGIPVGVVRNLAFVLASALGASPGSSSGCTPATSTRRSARPPPWRRSPPPRWAAWATCPAPSWAACSWASARRSASRGGGLRPQADHVRGAHRRAVGPPFGLFGKARALAAEPMTGTFFVLGKPFRLHRWQAAVLVAAALAAPFLLSDYALQVGTQVLTFALFALSLTLLAGNAGQISLGQAGPMALGAYASALLTTRAGLSFWSALLLSGVIAAAISVVLVAPSWRLRGHYVAIATLGTGAMIPAALLNSRWLTNGSEGIAAIPRPSLFGFTFETTATFYVLDLLVLLIAVVMVRRLQGSPLGRVWSGIREDETAVLSTGLDTVGYKSLAFAIGGLLAGLAGSLQAHQYGYIDPSMYSQQVGLLALTIVVLGGIRSPLGVVVGSAVLVGVPEFFRELQEYRMLIYGAVLVLLIRFRPQGLLGRRTA